MLGAFRGSPHKALELEAAVLPPAVRLESHNEAYAVRTLRFHKDHPVKQAVKKRSHESAESEAYSPNQNPSNNTHKITTQLSSLVSRVRKITGTQSLRKVEVYYGRWFEP